MSELLNVKQLARSKQRHSFNKDRQHSRRGRGAGGATPGGAERGRGGAGRGRGRGNAPAVVDSDDDDEDEDDEEKQDTSKFRRRAIVAQDKQFELNEPVDDDEIPKVDIDYLLKQPLAQGSEANFKFTDEREWDLDNLNPVNTIVIDCKKIAQKLKQLPLSKRLDLDLSQFGEAPLVEEDPLDVNTTLLKTIVIYPEYSSSSLFPLSLSPSSSPSVSSPFSSLAPVSNKSAEDSFLDELLAPEKQQVNSISSPSSISTPSNSSLSSSLSSLSLSSNSENKTVSKESGKDVNATSNVEDLEDWLDSVI